MKTTAIKTALAVIALAAFAGPALATEIMLEERLARAEEERIITAPIAGVQNRLWFDYLGDVVEAQKELSSDLRHATDIEDLRDAWEEYGHELLHERRHYISGMAERGYRDISVTIE